MKSADSFLTISSIHKIVLKSNLTCLKYKRNALNFQNSLTTLHTFLKKITLKGGDTHYASRRVFGLFLPIGTNCGQLWHYLVTFDHDLCHYFPRSFVHSFSLRLELLISLINDLRRISKTKFCYLSYYEYVQISSDLPFNPQLVKEELLMIWNSIRLSLSYS